MKKLVKEQRKFNYFLLYSLLLLQALNILISIECHNFILFSIGILLIINIVIYIKKGLAK